MTVVDVNTGKFTGSGGNLEETVTKNNLEAAEEIVRQLRLRDIGGIIVVDFIDMVLESNRDLVLRRLVECLGRDRTRHQVAEVTSLGLVQMTRKRIGTGLLEAFSHECEHCKGRGVVSRTSPSSRAAQVRRRRAARAPQPRRSQPGSGRRRRSAAATGTRNGGGSAPAPRRRPTSHAPGRRRSRTSEPDEGPAGRGRSSPTSPTQADRRRAERHRDALGHPARAGRRPVRRRAPESLPDDDGPSRADVPAPPEPPRLVTSTRRRTARRPAGPPAAVTEAISNAGAGPRQARRPSRSHVPVEPRRPPAPVRRRDGSP